MDDSHLRSAIIARPLRIPFYSKAYQQEEIVGRMSIRHVVTLDCYDGPVLFGARNRIGERFLALATAATRNNECGCAVVGVSPQRMGRPARCHGAGGIWRRYLALFNRTTGGFDLETQTTPLSASGCLPDKGCTLDTEASAQGYPPPCR